MKVLRKHQLEALEAIETQNEGIIQLPTGTGKTFIQASSIVNNIQSNRTFVILSPRILLTNQLYTEVAQILAENKKDCQYLLVHSGKADQADLLWADLPYRSITSTTSSKEIQTVYQKSLQENVPLVIFGTYDSAERIAQSGIPVYMLMCDEAHYLVTEEFNWIRYENTDNVKKYFHSERKYYFTATLKTTVSSDGLGMNNKTHFGEILYSRTPAEMIEMGEILRPRMHLVDVSIGEDDNEYDIDANSILEAFTEHKMHCKVQPKLLVVCKGSEHLNQIANHPKIKNELETTPNLKLFDISSEHKPRINGKPVSRDEFLKQLQALTDSDSAIILHVRILTEGIDVPGITGVMIMNNLKITSFLQTLGRSTRLYSNDRKRLYDGSLKYNELTRFTKPYAFVIIPVYGVIGADIRDNIKEMIYSLRSYGFNAREEIVIKQKRGKALPVPLDMLNELDTREYRYRESIYDIVHTVEEQEIADKLILEDFKLSELIENESLEDTIKRFNF